MFLLLGRGGGLGGSPDNNVCYSRFLKEYFVILDFCISLKGYFGSRIFVILDFLNILDSGNDFDGLVDNDRKERNVLHLRLFLSAQNIMKRKKLFCDS